MYNYIYTTHTEARREPGFISMVNIVLSSNASRSCLRRYCVSIVKHQALKTLNS